MSYLLKAHNKKNGYHGHYNSTNKIGDIYGYLLTWDNKKCEKFSFVQNSICIFTYD